MDTQQTPTITADAMGLGLPTNAPTLPYATFNAAQVELIGSVAGQVVENVFGVSAASPLSQAEASAIASTVHAWVAATYAPLVTVNLRWNRIVVRDVNPLGPVYEFPYSDLVGGNTQDPLPNNSTFCLKKNTGLGGRANRGRWYMVGVVNTAQVLSVATAAYANSAVTALNTLLTNLGTINHYMVLLHRARVRPHVVTGITIVNNISYADLNMDSQRRRLPSRGR